MAVIDYVVFEGIDGSGKTTQAGLFAKALVQRDVTPIELAEPTRGHFGQMAAAAGGDSDEARSRQRELFTLDRREHVRSKIDPVLAFVRSRSGFMLVQSRYYLSAPAYQAAGLDDSELRSLLAEQRAFAPPPDLFVVLDLPVDVAVERIAKRGSADLYESRQRLQFVRQRYQMLRELDPTPQAWIDATGSIKDVQDRVQRAVFER